MMRKLSFLFSLLSPLSLGWFGWHLFNPHFFFSWEVVIYSLLSFLLILGGVSLFLILTSPREKFISSLVWEVKTFLPFNLLFLWPLGGILGFGSAFFIFEKLLLVFSLSLFVGMRVYLKKERKRTSPQKNLYPPLLLSGILLFTLLYFSLNTLRYLSLNFHTPDLALFDQLIWLLSRGLPPYSTLLEPPVHFLGNHFNLILYLFVPFYWLKIPLPGIFFFGWTFLLFLGALPIFWLGEKYLEDKLTAFLLALAFLFFPLLGNMSIFPFYPEVLSLPLFLFLLYFLERGNSWAYFLFLFLVLSVKENIPLPIIFLGTYLLCFSRKRKIGLVTLLSGVFWLLGVVKTMSLLEANLGERFFIPEFGWLGETPLEMAKNALLNPLLVGRQIFRTTNIFFLLLLGGGGGIFSLLSPLSLLPALPSLFMVLLGENFSKVVVVSHYSAPLIPFLFWGMVKGVGKIRKKEGRRKISLSLTSCVLTGSIVSHIFFSSSPLSFSFWKRDYVPLYHRSNYRISTHGVSLKNFLAHIPSQASVAATLELTPWLSRREKILPLSRYQEAEYILLDTSLPSFWPLRREDYSKMFQNLLSGKDYGLLAWGEGYFLFKKGYKGKTLYYFKS